MEHNGNTCCINIRTLEPYVKRALEYIEIYRKEKEEISLRKIYDNYLNRYNSSLLNRLKWAFLNKKTAPQSFNEYKNNLISKGLDFSEGISYYNAKSAYESVEVLCKQLLEIFSGHQVDKVNLSISDYSIILKLNKDYSQMVGRSIED